MASESRLPLKIASSIRLGSRLLRILFERPANLSFSSGQYLLIDGNAFAIASAPTADEPLELLIRLPDEGPSRHGLERLPAGTRIENWSLAGKGFNVNPLVPKVRFFATGTAIAAYRSYLLSQAFAENAIQAELWAGFRSEEDLILIQELKGHPRIRLEVTLSQPGENWSGPKGRIDERVAALPAEFFAEHSLYSVCGQWDFVQTMLKLLNSRGVEPSLIFEPN